MKFISVKVSVEGEVLEVIGIEGLGDRQQLTCLDDKGRVRLVRSANVILLSAIQINEGRVIREAIARELTDVRAKPTREQFVERFVTPEFPGAICTYADRGLYVTVATVGQADLIHTAARACGLTPANVPSVPEAFAVSIFGFPRGSGK